MQTRFPIRSRTGNLALGIITAAEAVGAIVILLFYVVRSWDYATTGDRLFQILLAIFSGIAAHIASGAINESRRVRDRRTSAAATQ
jgi:hypothetical protein